MTSITSDAAAGDLIDPGARRLGKGIPAQHVVDDDLERPRLQSAERDLDEQQDRQQRPRAAGTARDRRASTAASRF